MASHSSDPQLEAKEAAMQRYHAAAHAVQSGVAMEMTMDAGAGSTTPKHLRTGLDMRAADAGALAKLLIEKGVFTELEYLEAIAAGAEREQAAYEQRLTERTGGATRVTLA